MKRAPHTLPDDIDDALDDIAYVYKWPLADLEALSLEDVAAWWARARRRLDERRG